MSEGILLDPVARGTLLSREARVARLDEALPQIRAAIADENDPIALEATLACLLWETLVQTNWCGFYRRVAENELAVGPYQGTMGCLRISLDRGVCGACARTASRQLVADVHAFPGHIACDDRTRSELVLPVLGARPRQALVESASHGDKIVELASQTGERIGIASQTGELVERVSETDRVVARTTRRVAAVLDLDSPHLDAFSVDEAERLELLLADAFHIGVRW